MSKITFIKGLLAQIADELSAIERENETRQTPSSELNLAPERQDIRGIRALARYLQVSTATAQKLKNDGTIPFYTIGDRVYFNPNDVDAAVKNQKPVQL